MKLGDTRFQYWVRLHYRCRSVAAGTIVAHTKKPFVVRPAKDPTEACGIIEQAMIPKQEGWMTTQGHTNTALRVAQPRHSLKLTGVS